MHKTLFVLNLNEYRTPRILKQRYSRTSGIVPQSYRSHRSSGQGYWDLTQLTEFQVRLRKCYRTHRSSGYCGTGVQNSQKLRAGIKMLYPYPGYLWHGRTEFPEVPSTGMNVAQNFHKFRVRVRMSYITYRGSL